MIFNESRSLHGFIYNNILDSNLYMGNIFMIGENILLKLKLKLSNQEHTIDDLRAHNKQLIQKVKKYENNNIGTTGNREDNNVVKPSGRVHSARG